MGPLDHRDDYKGGGRGRGGRLNVLCEGWGMGQDRLTVRGGGRL